MSNNVNKAVAAISNRLLIPGFYLGVKDKTIDRRDNGFWGSLFAGEPIRHDKEYLFWDEFQDRYPDLMPTDVAPCEEGESFSMQTSYAPKFVTQGYWHLEFPLTCDFSQYLRPGENPYSSPAFSAHVADYMLKMRNKLFGAFSRKEEYWMSRMGTAGKLIIDPRGGQKFEVDFSRSDDLNLRVDAECSWCKYDPKNSENDMDKMPRARPWDDFRRMDDTLWRKNRGRITRFAMTLETSNHLRNVINQYIANSKTGRAIDILYPEQIAQAGAQMPVEYDGSRLEFIVLIGARRVPVYTVETTFTFCDSDGKDTEVNTMSDGIIYGWNENVGNNAMNGRRSYGRIHNYHAENVMQDRFFHQYITANGKSMKYFGESAPMVLMECADSSVSMVVCPEIYKAPAAS